MRYLLLLLVPYLAGCCAIPEHPDRIPPQVFDKKPESYPLFLHAKPDTKTVYDANGIPMADFTNEGLGKVYHPTVVVQQSLMWWNKWLIEKKPEQWDRLVKYADWLIADQEPTGLWTFDWTNPWHKHNTAGWYSAFTQSQCSSFMLRMWKETGDGKYRDVARRAIAPFFKKVSDGGVITEWPDGDTYFCHISTPPHIYAFNAFCYSCLGLYEYEKYTNSGLTTALWEEAWRTAKRKIDLFDTGCWVLYDLESEHQAHWTYNVIQIHQMRWFYEITGDVKFKETADRWEGYFKQKANE